jgi:hypothetical protein
MRSFNLTKLCEEWASILLVVCYSTGRIMLPMDNISYHKRAVVLWGHLQLTFSKIS